MKQKETSIFQKIVRWGQLLILNAISILFLLLAFFLLLSDRAAAATVAASVAIALLIICYIPILDSFEVFGLKAKLRQQVNEADEVLDSLKNYATASSKILYDHLKWVRIMASPTMEETVEWYESLNRSLREMNVDEPQLRKNQQAFLDYLSWRLFSIFDRLAIERTQMLLKELRIELAASPDLLPKIEQLQASLGTSVRHFDDPTVRTLAVKVEHRLAELKLSELDIQLLREFAATLIEHSNYLQTTRRVGAQASRLLDEHELDPQRWRLDYQRVFGQKL